MKQTTRTFPCATVTKKAERSIISGHPWVYDTEILSADHAENGDLVDVRSEKGAYLGTGFLSVHSKIRIRLLCRYCGNAFAGRRG